jgi:hypothetical protein
MTPFAVGAFFLGLFVGAFVVIALAFFLETV